MTGLTLAQYRIDAELGRGGMGIVYRATDTKLDRTVALKVLPPHAMSSPDDRARFYREAKAAAQLHHAHIATIFEIAEAIPSDAPHGAEPRPYIAMEYVDGETLADRIVKGPMKLEEVVRVVSQVAGALGAAHEAGIVHRDIKSANVMLTSKGEAKVLDFGLAQTAASTKLTRMGSTLGTVAYMSPEQARGEEVDRRTDLWSLGAMLYEMIAGRLPFKGDYEHAMLYGILNEDPEPLTAVRTGVPMELERIVGKLLAKDVRHRYQGASDLVADLEALDVEGTGTSRRSVQVAAAARRRPLQLGQRFPPWSVAAAMFLVGVVGTWLLRTPPAQPDRPVRTMDLHLDGTPAAISPDGRFVVLSGASDDYAVFDAESGVLKQDLDVRHTWRHEFSPDGKWLLNSGGPAGGGLSRLRLEDNRSVAILDDGMGAAWRTDNVLLYTSNTDSSLWSVGIDGEAPTRLVEKDYDRDHIGLYFPFVLPGGRHALAHGWSGTSRDVVLADLESGTYEVLIPDAACARYLASGHLLYVDGGQTEGEIMVRPFDPGSRRFTGDETPAGLGEQSCWSVAVSGEGTAVIGTEADPQRRSLFWLSADGAVLEPLADPPVSIDESSAPRSAERISISPDGRWLATVVRSTSGSDVYLQDLRGGTPRRLTLTERAFHPTFSPDGQWIYYAEQSDSVSVIKRMRADQSGGAEFTGVSGWWPDVSADGSRLLAMSEWWEPARVFTLEASAMPSAGMPVPGTPDDREGALSPDGRSLATDGPEGIMVREVGGTAVFQVALGLPSQSRPRWSRDGRHLYFASRVSLYRVPVSLSPIFDYGQPEQVAEDLGGLFLFDLHPGGERILVWGQPPGSGNDAPSLRIVLNWFTRLREIAPVGRG